MKNNYRTAERKATLKAIRLEVLRHRDERHVVPIIGTREGTERALSMYQEVYGGKR